jgi:hypothetical protein
MSSNFWFHYQGKGGEDDWVLALAERRPEVAQTIKPAFVTVLDLSLVPDDHDWSKVKYRGPLYFDFDADGDIELACAQFQAFLGKLDSELDFDLTQARLFISGGKGFHVEIPQECFLPKVPPAGTAWLPYIYKAMAEALVVDTMDMRVYSGKRGRMWRTPNVKRENGNYKVAISPADALEVTPESYLELCSEPRPPQDVSPPFCNTKLTMLFERSREKIVTHMRGHKKRLAKASSILDPWKASKRHPPTIERLMAGENVAAGAGFQSLAMQLAIYATSVGMELDDFIAKCSGLCEKHVGDSRRYGTPAKRREELARMFRYMDNDSMYQFDPAPIVKLVQPGVPVADLGVMETEDSEDRPAAPAIASGDPEDGDVATTVATPAGDPFRGVRKGFFVNGQGMFRQNGDVCEPICRATLRNVESFHDVEKLEFKGFEFDIIVAGRRNIRGMLPADAFTASANLKKFFAAHQLSFQGGDFDAIGLLDVMAEKASRGGRTYIYPREGFFVIDNPLVQTPKPVKVYLTQHECLSSVAEGDEEFFKLRYRSAQAMSSYNIDIHRAPELNDDHRPAIHDLFSFTRSDVGADMIGWMVACHYRSVYMRLYQQFPLLQVYGVAGTGKTQTIWMLAHLHWFMTEISMKSAMSCTPFALDAHASSSTSAPLIIDEYKPRELIRIAKGRLEKLKDVFKMSYTGGDIGERGTINRGAENNLAVIKCKATAPIVFMGESIELESAIVERSVCVALSKSFQTKQRALAFNRLHSNPEALSAIGRDLVELGLRNLNIETMREEFDAILAEIEARIPDSDIGNNNRISPRMIYNRAIVIHGLRTLQKVLSRRYGSEFDEPIESMITYKVDDKQSEEQRIISAFGMSEASKVINRMSLMSRERDAPWQLIHGMDFLVDDGWVELKLERAFDCYRRFCVAHNEIPLYDNLDAFLFSMNNYSPIQDMVCVNSALRDDGSPEKIVRFDARLLAREGVQPFRT